MHFTIGHDKVGLLSTKNLSYETSVTDDIDFVREMSWDEQQWRCSAVSEADYRACLLHIKPNYMLFS
jgi:hypothetical protein